MTGGLSPTSAATLAADVVVLSTGDVRVPVYPDAAAAQPRAADQPYPLPAGTDALRNAIAARAGVPARDVLVAPGARLAILSVLAAAVADRREVLLPTPYWSSYPTLIRAAGGVPVVVPDVGSFAGARTRDTGVVVVNSPRNPDGYVVPAKQLRALVEWAGAGGITVLFDQVYRGVPGVGPVAPSVLDLGPGLPAHCAVVDGLSKSHALAGLRLGWALVSGALREAAVVHASHVVGGTGVPVQEAALAALADRGVRSRLEPVLAANLEYALGRLATVPGVACRRPEGGIFLFPEVRFPEGRLPGGGPHAADRVRWLREEHRLAVVDGAAFGAPGHLRLSFAVPPDQLRTGIDRLCLALRGPAGTGPTLTGPARTRGEA